MTDLAREPARRSDARGAREPVGNVAIRRALLSVSDKRGLVELAQALTARGVELISTGGTAAALRAAGLDVRDVSAVTGFPEMLDGRVKTLHPAVFAAILARRDRPDDMAALRAHRIEPVDLVVVNLYPFEEAAAAAHELPDDALEQIDVGGPSLLRAAAKNYAAVAVLCDTVSYAAFLEELDRLGGEVTRELRRALAARAYAHTAAYDLNVSAAFGVSPAALGERVVMGGRRLLSLRYGENPHQRAAFYSDPLRASGLAAAQVLQGKELSYNNLLDLDAAWRLSADVQRALRTRTSAAEANGESVCVIVKHTNPCGVGVAGDAAAAYERARATDPVSAFGGVCVLGDGVGPDVVEASADHFLEILAAPHVEPAAREGLARKRNLRVLELPVEDPAAVWDVRRVAGGVLLQEADEALLLDRSAVRVVTGELTDETWAALTLGWAVAKHVKSNAIVIGDATGTLGVGAGQMSRVDAVDLAIRKAGAAGLQLAGSVAASDAFFPFRDGLDRLADAGVVAVIQPGGSVRDPEVIAAAQERGITLVHTGERHFRH